MQPPCPPGSAPALRPGPQRARDLGPLSGALKWSGDWARGCRPAPHLSVTCVSALGPWAPQVVLVVKSPPVNSGDIRDAGLIPGSGRSPEKEMATHSSTLTGKSHGQRSLAGCSPRSHRESDTAWHAPLPKATAASAGQGAALWWGAQGHRSCQSHPRGSSSPCWGIPWGGHLVPHRSGEACPQEVPVSSGRERRGCHHAMQAMGDLALCVSPSWRHA